MPFSLIVSNMARRSDHSREELRVLIFEAAWAIIGKNGVQALTARSVAAEIGYTPGTIYNLFESMDDLILTINMKTLEMLHTALNQPICHDSSKSPLQNAKTMAGQYIKFAKKHRPYWLLLYTHNVSAQRFENAAYKEAVNTIFEPLERILGPLYKNQNDRRQKISARALWASVHGICFLQETNKLLLLDNKATPEETIDTLIETFFAGLKS